MNRPASSSKIKPNRFRWIPAISLRVGIFAALAGVVAGAGIFRTSLAAGGNHPPLTLSASLSAAETSAQARDRVLFFEQRLARNPDDIDILNRLSGFYLQRLRESGAFSDLDLALRAAQRSLRTVPAVRNVAGLTSLAMANFASHNFTATRDESRLLTQLDGTQTPYALLGDAEAELGDYAAAAAAYARLERAVGSVDENVTTRHARMDLLHGDNAAATRAFGLALAAEAGRVSPSRERLAWYSWQLGDTAFFSGDLTQARARYADALQMYPGYFKALASLGRLDAATGAHAAAISEYTAAIEQLPDPTFVAELGDVYAANGDRALADREYALVDAIGHLSAMNGVMYNRQLVMFDADHNRNAREAFRLAKLEYHNRRDILGADAVAWTALKAGALPDAQAAMHAALRLGTRDPRLFYHAGMIALAAGDTAAARRYLTSVVRLNPAFDVLQAPIAHDALLRLSPGNEQPSRQ